MRKPSNKEELILRVLLFGQNETAAITARQEEQLKDLVRIFKLLVLAQKKLAISTHRYSRRKYTTKSYSHFVPAPENIDESNIQELFDPLIEYIDSLRSKKKR